MQVKIIFSSAVLRVCSPDRKQMAEIRCRKVCQMSNVTRGDSPCYCINTRRMAGAMSHIYDFYLRPVGLSANQYALLVDLGRLGSASTTDLAAFVGLNRSTLVRTLRPLIKKGLIEDKSLSGRRSREFQLTESGRKIVEEGRSLWQAAQDLMETELGTGEMSLIKEFASRIENLEHKILP